jgi:glycosyltransferase involved in cell wall biosynthesis
VHKGVQYLFIREGKKAVRFPRHTHRIIKSLQPDVVLINGFIFPLQVIQLRWKLGRKVKIMLLHRAEQPRKGWRKYLQKLADRYVDAYLFTSAEFGEQWKGNIDTDKMHEVIQASSIFSVMDRAVARQNLNINAGTVFLWVGSLIPRKDPVTVVKAFVRFLEIQPSARLYMIYQSDELLKDVLEIVNSNEKTAAGIVMVGKVAHAQLQDWYNSADFIITGSHYEGSGVAVSEAMSCGCIPIVTDIISFRKMTGPAKCGFLYEAGNVDELLKVLVHTEKIEKEKEQAKTLEQFKQELSFDAIARKIQQVVASL